MKKTILSFLVIGFRLSSQTWQFAGDSMASDWEGSTPFIALDKLQKPYIVYRDNQPIVNATVKRFEGGHWLTVGGPASDGDIFKPSMDFDSLSVPYIAFTDQSTNHQATVKKYDGTSWVNVGNKGFTANSATNIIIKFAPDNTPYIAFRDFNENGCASVMRYDGNNWVYVGQLEIPLK